MILTFRELGEFSFSPIAPRSDDVIEIDGEKYIVLYRKFSNDGVTLVVRREREGMVLA